MLPSDKLELAVYRALITFGSGPVPPQITIGLLSQRMGESDHAAIVERLKYLDLEGYIALKKYNGGTIWARGDSPDAAFFHMGAFMAEITPRGRKYFENLEHEAEPHAKSSSGNNSKDNETVIFISCGQSTASERKLGKEVVSLVERETGCHAYFAENQNSLAGVTEHILRRLYQSSGFIAIMHPRGDVSNPHDNTGGSWVRASVWVEQEIAIAAFMSQVLNHPMQVRSYVHKSIRREGLRDKILLNPMSFCDDSEVLDDLKSTLSSWRQMRVLVRNEEFSLKPKITSRRAPVPGEGDDRRYELSVSVLNDGERGIPDITLNVEFPSIFLDGGGHSTLRPSSKPGMSVFEVNTKERNIGNIYPEAETPSLIPGIYFVVRGHIMRNNPELLQQKVTAIVCSPLTKASRATKSIAELMQTGSF